MPSLNYGTRAYRRTNGSFPELKLINLYVEHADTSENQIALLSRSGLAQLSAVGSGPINGLFASKGTFSGDVFTISGSTLYRVAASKGAIAGSGIAKFAGSDVELVVTRGTTARSYNGTNLQDIAFPDGANVLSTCFIGSLFVAVRGGSGRFYWSAVLDGRTWDALNYATAEREPDQLLDIAPLGDNIWLFGQQSIEAWSHTGALDLPFSRLENVAFDKGIMATGCVVPADNSLFFIGSNRSVYRIADSPLRISDHAIDERILGSSSAKLFTFIREGHEFVCVRLDDETFAYDCATQEWCEFQSAGGQWIASDACTSDAVTYLGHQSTGQLLGFSGWMDLSEQMERRFTAAQQLDQALSIDTLKIWANPGATPVLSGLGSEPIIEMRCSDDAGRTWMDWDSESLGVEGDYQAVPTWRALGQFGFPGFMAEFRVTDPVPLRISAVKVNDRGGGR